MANYPRIQTRPTRTFRAHITAALGLLLLFGAAAPGVRASDAQAPRPDHSRPAPPPPAKGLVVLFSGKPSDVTDNWLQLGSDKPAQWTVEDGAMVTRKGDIYSKQKFADFQLHIEFRVPYMPNAHGQARGNSGVFLQGLYEIQVLDSYGIADPGTGDCGAVYGQAAPLVNACKPPLQWQAYDIVFHAARVNPDTHDITEPARVTVLQNGIAVQNSQVIRGPTGAPMDIHPGEPGPIRLQYHGDRMEFRNVWVIPLPPHGANHY